MASVMPAASPRKVLLGQVLVRNTFIEVHDGESEQMDLDNSQPAYRRRRGSSFFRSSSAPLTAGRAVKGASDSEYTDMASTQDLGSDSEHTHVTSYADDGSSSSRSQSPAPNLNFGHFPLLNQPSLNEPDRAELLKILSNYMPTPGAMLPPGNFQQHSHDSALAAAMNAGFNAGVMAAAMRSGYNSALQNSGNPQLSGNPSFGMPLPVTVPLPQWTGRLPNCAEAPQLGAQRREALARTNVVAEFPQLPVQKACHLIWCDHRAFKESSASMRDQLQTATGLNVKTHRTAENCLRLLRKKRNSNCRPPCVFLASLANAPALLAYLSEADHVRAKVVVLAESRRQEAGNALLHQFPLVTEVAKSWPEAVQAICRATAEI